MNKHHRWLKQQIEIWRLDGTIDDHQAEQLWRRYPVAAATDWSRLLFTGLGVVIFGLGIMLFLAYNWQGMHRFTKLAFIAVTLLTAHGLGCWYSAGQRQPRLAESMHLLGTMLFGAGIWLVAQIYHIDEHYPNAYLIWSLAALSLAWAIPSLAHGLLTLMLVFLWSWFEVFDFHHANHWAPWLVAVGVIPLAWQRRSPVLLFFSLGVLTTLYAFALLRVNDDIVFTVLLLTACGYLALSWLVVASDFADSAGVFRSVGYAVYLLLVFIAGFSDLDGKLFKDLPDNPLAWLYWSLPLAFAVISWSVLLLRSRHLLSSVMGRLEAGLIVATTGMVALSSLSASGLPFSGGLFNLIFLTHGVLFVLRGNQQLHWQQTALGGLMLAVLIFARFMDLFDSLLLRSLAFVLIGAGLFVMGQLFNRRKRQQQGSPARETTDA